MKRIVSSLAAGLASLAFAAAPGIAPAQEYDRWGDWDWNEGYEFGENEYGTGLAGEYDNENATDDWYYDSYGYGDEYAGTYDDEYGYGEYGENEEYGTNDTSWEYDSDLFGDDEWEYGEGNDLFGSGGDYEGYGYGDSEYGVGAEE